MADTEQTGTYGMTPEIEREAQSLADQFVTRETSFHLGFLPTEQPHPYTAQFSDVVQSNPAAGVDLLLAVDQDIPPVARRVFCSGEYAKLVDAMVRAAAGGRRICFSGCGSTGRLAMLLEAMWRQYWEDRAGLDPGDAARRPTEPQAVSAADEAEPQSRRRCFDRANLACSIMTGGDRALIRSVENFEDYPQFGARQVVDLGIGRDDLFVAVSEGGETSSVIGSAHEALARGATVFLVCNNPAEMLRQRIRRSAELIDHPDVSVLDLSTGPMALTGSTRMQATTIELLVLGTSMSDALECIAAYDSSGETPCKVEPDRGLRAANTFARLVHELKTLSNRTVLGALAAREADIYRNNGLVTYFADRFLLDIFCDTTERTPTFTLPPFRAADDRKSPHSWAFAKDPCQTSDQAWFTMLRRNPRGLRWTAEDYRAMGAPEPLVSRPPVLDETEIARYSIGNEADPERIAAEDSLSLAVFVDTGDGQPAGWPPLPGRDNQVRALRICHREAGDARPPTLPTDTIRLTLPANPVHLWHHLAVKLVFNTMSTATMGIIGRTRQNWMVQLDPTNKKLIDRGSRIISTVCEVPYADACRELYRTLLTRMRRTEDSVDLGSVSRTAAPGTGGDAEIRPAGCRPVSPVMETITRLKKE